MAIAPNRLNGVAADFDEASKLKGLRGERLLGAFVQVSHHIAFADASGAWAETAQVLDGDKIFPAVFPFQGKLGADLLEVKKAHV